MRSERLTALSGYIRQHRYCRMGDLAEHFHISLATIHRDVQELVVMGHVHKVHGGVVSLLAAAVEQRQDGGHFLQRMELQREAKAKVAAAAEREIVNGDVIFLDSSTTCMFLARRLQESRLAELSILTNSVLVAQEFHRFPPCFVMVCVGGCFNVQLNSFLGRMALDSLRQLRISKAFISCAGYAGGRITTYLEEHATFLRGVLDAAQRTYLLVDRSKATRTGLYSICELSRVDKVISS